MVIAINITNHSARNFVVIKNTAKFYQNIHGRLEFNVNEVVCLTSNYVKMNSYVGAFFDFRYLTVITNHQSFRARL